MLKLSYDNTSNILHFGESEKFSITTPERKILCLLISKRGEVCSREVLIKEAWGSAEYIGSNSLNVAISNLRKILSPKGFKIVTKPKVGYLIEVNGSRICINNREINQLAEPSSVDGANTPHLSKHLHNENNIIRSKKIGTYIHLIIIFISVNIILIVMGELIMLDIKIENGIILEPNENEYIIETIN